ncbi:hypothetical protein FK535_05985 [Mycolicibacterium sp. 018/SC-01/001]|uniref:hypothetical protein n=1 Tax=Mycolicibacterium sp. 018/SC-01/001 TaxID=2592069 RepID=UPI0011809F9B|nr:hypothetical protein [Mycolicibacterium sp. 018/SC-01/001]TRW87975.1 hypothetical protein FK535_05985 [Mycolicibacterium sp. 018/SC-01/001]
MSVTSKTRSVARTGLKVQRRVALAQFLFVPTLLTAALLTGALIIARRRDRSASNVETLPVPDSPAATA